MNAQELETIRQEIKFVAAEIRIPEVLHWLKTHQAGFFSPYPDRWINNVYFDSHDHQAYAENIAGVSQRSKVRYRWYGHSRLPGPGVLEIKQKRNHLGWKKNFDVSTAPYCKGGNWQHVRRELMSQVNVVGRKYLQDNNLPVLTNHYLRRYFLSADKRIRVTIDTHQHVFCQRFKSSPNFTAKAHLDKTLVLEIKFHPDDYALASQLVKNIPLRISRHSKYINGMSAISGG